MAERSNSKTPVFKQKSSQAVTVDKRAKYREDQKLDGTVNVKMAEVERKIMFLPEESLLTATRPQ